MKKLLILILVLVMITVAGCGGGDTSPESDTQGNTGQDAVSGEVLDGTPEEIKEDVPKEYQSALKKADAYANGMDMSKAGVYDQLVSEYGEGFSEEAAQYAIDNVEADWNENALQKAILYQDDMAMSPNAIRDQLISEYGEKFTEEEAQYALDNLPK